MHGQSQPEAKDQDAKGKGLTLRKISHGVKSHTGKRFSFPWWCFLFERLIFPSQTFTPMQGTIHPSLEYRHLSIYVCSTTSYQHHYLVVAASSPDHCPVMMTMHPGLDSTSSCLLQPPHLPPALQPRPSSRDPTSFKSAGLRGASGKAFVSCKCSN